MSGRPINEDRQNAIALGLRTYTGSVHAKCGTDQRYVSGGGCVHCARVIATEQRDARKFLQQHAADEAEQKIRDDDGVALDSLTPDGLETDDERRARVEASIDDLM